MFRPGGKTVGPLGQLIVRRLDTVDQFLIPPCQQFFLHSRVGRMTSKWWRHEGLEIGNGSRCTTES